MALEKERGLVNLLQISLLALPSEMEEQGVLQLRAVETEAESFNGFFFDEALSYFSHTIRSGMAANGR
jgi:hypothetical protein